MNIFIPQYGTVLKLTKPFVFNIKPHSGTQDRKTLDVYFGKNGIYTLPQNVCITLPVGTILVVEKIEIKRNFQENNYIKFKIWECPLPEFKYMTSKIKGYFSVKIDDVNKMEADIQ